MHSSYTLVDRSLLTDVTDLYMFFRKLMPLEETMQWLMKAHQNLQTKKML